MERLNSGELKTIFRNFSSIVIIGLTTSGRKAWQEEEETRKDFNIVLTRQDKKFFISELFKLILDAISLILLCRTMYLFRTTSSSTFIMSDVQSNSIINSGVIPGGQILSNRQTVCFLPVDPMDKEHKDPEKIDLNAPRHAQYMHKAWKKHQNTVYWVDINLAMSERIAQFYQTRSNAIILQDTLPAYCIPKVVRLKTVKVIYEKVYMCHLGLHRRSP